MKTEVIREEYAIEYHTVYDEALTVSWNELKEAEIGKTWYIEDQDKYPNRTSVWNVSYTKVYQDASGCAVVYRYEEPGNEEVSIGWFEFA